MNSYGYFTAPTEEFSHPFCAKCTSSYGCVCDMLVEHGHCASCMNAPEKCECSAGWMSSSTYQTVYPTIMKPKKDAADAKHAMRQLWKIACDAEGVPFTRKEHCAYPRVLATYHQLKKEADAVKILGGMSGCE